MERSPKLTFDQKAEAIVNFFATMLWPISDILEMMVLCLVTFYDDDDIVSICCGLQYGHRRHVASLYATLLLVVGILRSTERVGGWEKGLNIRRRGKGPERRR